MSLILKAYHFVYPFVSKYKIYIILTAILSGFGYVGYLKYTVSKQKNVIYDLNLDIEVITRANRTTNDSLDKALVVNKTCLSKYHESIAENNRVLDKLNEAKNIKSERIKYIKVLQPSTACDSVNIDSDFENWMRNPQTNSRNTN